jgi:hypothetical protein
MDVALIDGLFIRTAGAPGRRTLLFVHAFADCGSSLLPLRSTANARMRTIRQPNQRPSAQFDVT